MNKMKQFGLALQNHHDVYKRFPAVEQPRQCGRRGQRLVAAAGLGGRHGRRPSVGYTTDAGTTTATAGYSWIVKDFALHG